MNGLLLVDKPSGWTSFDVVNKIRRTVQASSFNTSGKKRFPVGHTGTLDPLATGLLVLLLGKDTTHAMSLTKLDKTYEVMMNLGETSATGDAEGEITPVSDIEPTKEALDAALQQFVGTTMQTPPIFSAIKINGQRAYKLAREGKTPEMQPRPAHIKFITLTAYEYPLVRFTTYVSSGTYIRSLVGDVGIKLGTGAYMSDLRRTTVGDYNLKDAMSMDDLSAESVASHLLTFEDKTV